MKQKPQPRRWSKAVWKIVGTGAALSSSHQWLQKSNSPITMYGATSVLPPGRKRVGQLVTIVFVLKAARKRKAVP